jgi:hypothetical protein
MKTLYAITCGFLAFTAPVCAADKPWIPWNMTLTTSAGGRFEKWEKPIPCKNGQVSTILWIKNPRTSDPWTAGAYFDFRSDDQLARLGLSTMSLQTARLYPFGRQIDDKGKVVARQIVAEAIAVGRAVKMDVQWKDAHTVSAVIDGKIMNEMTFKKPIRTIRLFVQGTNTTFDRSTLECGLTS